MGASTHPADFSVIPCSACNEPACRQAGCTPYGSTATFYSRADFRQDAQGPENLPGFDGGRREGFVYRYEVDFSLPGWVVEFAGHADSAVELDNGGPAGSRPGLRTDFYFFGNGG